MDAKMNTDTLYVFLDFEATCEKDAKNYPNEIIEFPMVAATITNGIMFAVGEFQQYVRPTINPILTTFCRELTGITQHQVQNSGTLDVVVKQAAKWVHECADKHGATDIIMCTWGTWDLTTCLPNDAHRKSIKVPSVFTKSKVINLRQIFMDVMCARPSGLEDALTRVGLEFIGSPHSGIDDTRNTLFLAKHIYECCDGDVAWHK
jgi:ERI1 exoribonuclease 2